MTTLHHSLSIQAPKATQTIADAFALWLDLADRFGTLPDTERPASHAHMCRIEDAALLIPPADALDVYRKLVMTSDPVEAGENTPAARLILEARAALGLAA